MTGPLSQVAGAIRAGAATRREVSERTGLSDDVVDASLDHLLRMGRLQAEHIGSGCPDGGCSACPSGKSSGAAGCGAAGPANARGPVLLKLTSRPE